MKTLFFDTETTDLNPGQIAQLSFIIEENGKILEAKNYFFTVDSMGEGAQRVHGMSKEFLFNESGGKRFGDFAEELFNYFSTTTLVAHNLKFDEKFMSSEFWRQNLSLRPAGRQCTMEYFKDVLKIPAKNTKYGKYKNPRLEEVVDAFKIDKEKVLKYSSELFGNGNIGFHDSRYDTTAMYIAVNIYREMLSGGRDWHNAFCK